jgi:RNA methyltransferase, TrmH family
VQRITSRQNAVVAEFRDAAHSGGDALLLDGAHLVNEAIAAGLHLRRVIVAADALDVPEIARLIDRLDPRSVDLFAGNASVLDAVSPVRSSSRIVALASRPTRRGTIFDGPSTLVVVACDIQDPGNLGAIVRVAEGAGSTGLVAAGPGADPFGWKALRGSMGSALRLPIVTASDVDNAIDEARRQGARIVATVPRDGVPLFDAQLTGRLALLIGGEGAGLPPQAIAAADLHVTIPMEPPVESLNAAVAAAVLLYEARRQRTHAARVDGELRRATVAP